MGRRTCALLVGPFFLQQNERNERSYLAISFFHRCVDHSNACQCTSCERFIILWHLNEDSINMTVLNSLRGSGKGKRYTLLTIICS